MPRRDSEQSNAVGQDAFLDVVTNIVGILIILVLIVGLRIKNAPATPAPTEAMIRASESLGKDQATEASLRHQVAETDRQIHSLEQEAILRGQERDLLATAVAAAQREIGARRGRLDAGSQADFDRRCALADAQAELQQLKQQRGQIETVPGQTVLVESFPTPIGKIAMGEEAHFQLRGNRLALLPLEKLILAARTDARAKADKVLDRSGSREFTEVVGPEGGFQLRYTARRVDRIEETREGTVRRVGLQFVKWEAIPIGGQLGEPIEAALAEGSQFRKVLAGLPKGTTVTVWIYEDSFEGFRDLRKELHRLGIPVAARPIPQGILIGGSPKGTRSETE